MISFTNHDGLDVKNILAEGGLIAASYAGFEIRPQQLKMAQAVQEAFEEGYHLAVEAGTGVGKSYAYLVSAIDQVRQKKGKVLISTYTITLQEQLINKDTQSLPNRLKDFEAYSWEALHAHETGLIKLPDEMKDVGKRLKAQGWDKMTDKEKKANKETYNKAIKIIRKAIGDKRWQP